MTPEMNAVLLEVLKRTDLLKTAPAPKKYLQWDYQRWQDEQEYGPRWAPGEWFGGRAGLTDRERMSLLRSLRRLASAGLVVLWTDPDGGRDMNVKLTPSGERAARRLTGQQTPE
jgi:Winged helix DNA-binding domain